MVFWCSSVHTWASVVGQRLADRRGCWLVRSANEGVRPFRGLIALVHERERFLSRWSLSSCFFLQGVSDTYWWDSTESHRRGTQSRPLWLYEAPAPQDACSEARLPRCGLAGWHCLRLEASQRKRLCTVGEHQYRAGRYPRSREWRWSWVCWKLVKELAAKRCDL